ncbi:MAG: carboxy-S-adenosyl-L-methionine synthase CmoA [Phycisphaerales bacterium]|nr:carboxy-S-adenosyl-L-methionine synthase CmoA [Phycisphaerales bacterium]
MAEDTIFRATGRVSDFAFDERVVAVFDDMVSRSVPCYDEVQTRLAELVIELLPEGDCVAYDLGCSTGTTAERILSHPNCPPSLRIIGVDNAPEMIGQARHKLAPWADRVELIESDLNDFEPEPCSVVIMNWTLQFVRPIHRESMVRRIRDALRPGGCFFLSEKVMVADSMLNRVYIEIYLRYKRGQGYTDEEIRRKREALENVLVPYRIEENVALLQRCGFTTVDTWFRWMNFASMLAVRGHDGVGEGRRRI